MCHMTSCESIVMPPDESGIDEPEEDEEEVDINIDEGFLTDSAGNSVDLAPAAETVDTRAGQPSNVAAAPALGNTFVFFFCALGGHNAAGPVSLVDMIQTGKAMWIHDNHNSSDEQQIITLAAGLGNVAATSQLSIAPVPAAVMRGGEVSCRISTYLLSIYLLLSTSTHISR